MDRQQGYGQIIRVDISRDYSLAKMISLLMIAFFFLVMGFFIDIFEILGYVAWYLLIILLILWDRTTVDVKNDVIEIRRLFFGSVKLERKDITETVVKSNYNFALRCIMYLIMVAMSVYLFYDAFSDIQRYQIQNAPLDASISLILSQFMTISLFMVLFFNMERRLRHSNLVKVNTKDKSFVFYPDKPKEFEKLIIDQS